MSGAKRARGQGKRLYDAQRLEIVNIIDGLNPPSLRSIGRQFEVNEKVIRNIKESKYEIKNRTSTMTEAARKKSKRASTAMYPDMERLLFDWLTAVRQSGLMVPPSMLQQKALDIAKSLGHEDFKASNGWLQNYRKRFTIGTMLLHGEGGEVDKNDPVLLQQLDELMDLIDTYEYQNMYNMDETGLFYRLLPRYTLLLSDEDDKTVSGKKIKKNRITLALCANVDGSHKIDLALIGTFKKTACIVGKQ